MIWEQFEQAKPLLEKIQSTEDSLKTWQRAKHTSFFSLLDDEGRPTSRNNQYQILGTNFKIIQAIVVSQLQEELRELKESFARI